MYFNQYSKSCALGNNQSIRNPPSVSQLKVHNKVRLTIHVLSTRTESIDFNWHRVVRGLLGKFGDCKARERTRGLGGGLAGVGAWS